MVTGLLVCSGLQPPQTPMPADEWNAEGYGESAVMHQFHERVLELVETRWDAHSTIAPEWFESPQAAALRNEARGLLKQEFNIDTPFVLKDPRVCRLLPLWLGVFAQENIRPSAVLVVRNPYDVAASLKRRNGLPCVQSLLSWLRHVLEAEFHSRSLPRTILLYDDVIADWRTAFTRLVADDVIHESCRSLSHDSGIDRVVRRDLRHHQANSASPDTPLIVTQWLDRTWSALSALVGGDRSSVSTTLGELDTIRADFERTIAALDVDLADVRRRAELKIGGFEREMATLRAHLEDLVAERDGVLAAINTLHTEVAELQGTNAQLLRRCEELVSDRDVRLGVLTARAETLESRLVEVTSERGLLDERVTTLESRLAEVTSERGLLVEHVTTLEEERAALRASRSWRLTAPLRGLYRLVR